MYFELPLFLDKQAMPLTNVQEMSTEKNYLFATEGSQSSQ